jgi:heat shock protein HslJ
VRILRILLVAAAVTVLAACSGTSGDDESMGGAEETAQTAEEAATLDMTGDWTLASGSTADGDIALVEGAPVTMVVAADGSVSGNAGCNQYTTAATIEGGAVSFGPVASTMMACAEDVMAAESAYLAALGSVNAGENDGAMLTLSGNGAELVFDPTE